MNEVFSLKGKKAWVTGAGRGIGRAISLSLAEAGAELVLTSRSAEQLEETRRQLKQQGARAAVLPADLGNIEDADALVALAEAEGALDIVVHSAGAQHREAALTFPREAWDQVVGVNLTAPFLISQALGRRQIGRDQKGSHVFVASLTSILGLPDLVAYNAAKSGLMGVVRALSREWSSHGLRFNAISPGYVETAMTARLFNDAEKRQKLLDRIPMGEFGTPEQLGPPTVFLASEASAYMTGQLLIVDGGWAAA